MVQVQSYGKTNEGRELILAYVSTAQNLSKMEALRKNNLAQAGLLAQAAEDNGLAVVWLSYNVHGNEASSSEAAMNTVYKLVTEHPEYLENLIVLMDPMVNPDGRDRYVNWFNQVQSKPYNQDLDSKEHNEPWPGGRPNHYLFDLNRDWAWLSQVESQQRIAVYNQWLPQVHVDFHEQGIDEPYYFAPAAEPFHEVISDWQRDFQTAIGKNHAKYFDAEGWLYFTRERFDLLYPSYGDTYPTYMGAIGMTYEQGGHTLGGLGVMNREGELLTLKDRLTHHTTTGLSTVEMAHNNAAKLVEEFSKFYKDQSSNYYKTYVLSGKDQDKLRSLTSLLDKHEIRYSYGSSQEVKAYDYDKQSQVKYRINSDDIIISASQPKGKMVKVLFEPKAKLSDSLTYDITAWSLPYAYGIQAYATTSTVKENRMAVSFPMGEFEQSDYGYIQTWTHLDDASFLSELMNQDIVVRFSQKDFGHSGMRFKAGSLIILSGDNKHVEDFHGKLAAAAKKYNRSPKAVNTGFSDSPTDFGSPDVIRINKQKVALLSGEGTSSLSFGEIWHYFETQLHYPITIIDTDYASRIDLKKYDVLILPNGYYGSDMGGMAQKVKDFARSGGTVIAIGNALNSFGKDNGFGHKRKSLDISDAPNLKPYKVQEREGISNLITGAIFQAQLDPSHPLGFGYDSTYFSLKLSGTSYELLDNGMYNVGYFGNASQPVSGFAGARAVENVPNSLFLGVQPYGRGGIVYMVDNPLFRSFWQNGKLFMANAVFMYNSDRVR
jgi:hypothetical protein